MTAKSRFVVWCTGGIGSILIHAIQRRPDIDCTVAATVKDPAKSDLDGMTSGAGAMVATVMRVLNAVPYVDGAEPGLISSLDLPLTIPKNAFVAA